MINIDNKIQTSIPLITSIYYDNKNKENENNLFLNDLRITYEILENDEKKYEENEKENEKKEKLRKLLNEIEENYKLYQK